jgi:heat shock protein HtpX
LFHYLPLLGAIAGVVIGLLSWGVALPTLGLAVLLASAGWWGQRRFTYRNDFSEERNVSSLVGEVKVSGVRAIPCTLRGGIIGRGVPGLFYSEDLVLQDGSGYITLDYRQPLRLLEFLFGWLRAEKLIGLQGTAMGWYRRAPRPYLELRRLILENGEKVTTYGYPLAEVLVYVGILAGLGLTFVRW